MNVGSSDNRDGWWDVDYSHPREFSDVVVVVATRSWETARAERHASWLGMTCLYGGEVN